MFALPLSKKASTFKCIFFGLIVKGTRNGNELYIRDHRSWLVYLLICVDSGCTLQSLTVV